MRVYAACHPERGDHAHAATYACKCGAHQITFVWRGGNDSVHIDDHDREAHGVAKGHVLLRGCDRGCASYRLVRGDDPRAAPSVEWPLRKA